MELKERILLVSKDKFMKDGFNSFNMDLLAHEMGISKKTIYENYESKKELFGSVVEYVFKKHAQEAQELQKKMTKDGKFHFLDEIKNLWELISEHQKNMNDRFLDDIKRYAPDKYKFCEILDDRKRETFLEVFRLGKEENYIKADFNENLFFLMYVYPMQQIIKPEILAELSLNTKQALQMIFDILFLGVLSEKGVNEYNRIIKNKG